MAPRLSRRLRPKRLLVAAIVAAAVLFGLYRLVIYRVVAHQLQVAATQIPGCRGMRYDALRIPYFSLQCEVQNVVLLFQDPNNSIPARSLQVRRFRPGKALPRILDVTVHDLILDTRQPNLTLLRTHRQALDRDKLSLSADLEWVREGDQQELWTVKARLRAAAAGRLSMALRLDKVNAQGVVLAIENPVNWWLVLPAVQLVTASGRYEDRGLFERVIGAAARRQGRPPEEIRKAFADDWARQALTAQDPQVKAFWQSLAAFNRQPAALAFETHLPRPLALALLWWVRTPGQAVRSLNLEVRHERGRGPPAAGTGEVD